MENPMLTRITKIKIAAAIVFALAISSVAVRPALADHHHGWGEHGHWRGEGWHGHDWDRGRGGGFYVAPAPNYYYTPPPNYYYTPEPEYYYPPEPQVYVPPVSEGINLFFGIH